MHLIVANATATSYIYIVALKPKNGLYVSQFNTINFKTINQSHYKFNSIAKLMIVDQHLIALEFYFFHKDFHLQIGHNPTHKYFYPYRQFEH